MPRLLPTLRPRRRRARSPPPAPPLAEEGGLLLLAANPPCLCGFFPPSVRQGRRGRGRLGPLSLPAPAARGLGADAPPSLSSSATPPPSPPLNLQGTPAAANPDVDLDQYRKPSIEEEISPVGKFFGAYLQFGVWVGTIILASSYAFQHVLAGDPEEIGVLGLVPAGALILFSTFAGYRFYISKKAEAEKAAGD